nr:hypothetical protein [uncultured Dysosmobacter sp.]
MNATDQLAWVGAMNCIRSAGEETVLNELICDGAVPKKASRRICACWQEKRGTICGIWCLPMSWVVICAIVRSIKSLRQS